MNTITVFFSLVVLIIGTLAVPTPEAAPEPLGFERNPNNLQIDPAVAFDGIDLLRQKKSYAAPAAPAYSAPAAPAYAPPAPAYAPSKLSYSAPAPSIPCSKAIIVSCAPSVQPAPCSAPAAY